MQKVLSFKTLNIRLFWQKKSDLWRKESGS
jgi:hypothetical protein